MTDQTQPAPPEEKKPMPPALIAGGSPIAIVPQDIDQIWRVAGMIIKANMSTKSLDSQEKVAVAIMHGLELGLTPMAAIQSIAVINGTPSIWGDGMIALVRKSGLLEDIIESVEDDKDGPTIAVCKVKRAGSPSWVVQSFTRPEAMRAGLWKKAGPWTQYPRRMMQMRARSWALRDAFPDVLRGLHSAEEAADMIDVTPRGSATTAPPEPRRSDYVYADQGGPKEKEPDADPPHDAETGELKEPTAADKWTAIGTGQEALTASIIALIDSAKSEADLAHVEEFNAARYAKFTDGNRRKIALAIKDIRDSLGSGPS